MEPSDRLIDLFASKVLASFRAYRAEFDAITDRAKTWFEKRDWPASQRGTARRLDIYGEAVADVCADIRVTAGESLDATTWRRVKGAYTRLIAYRADEEIAETYFNSVTRALLGTVGVDETTEFVWLGGEIPLTGDETPIYHAFHRTESMSALFESVLRAHPFDVPYEDLDRDAARIAERVAPTVGDLGGELDAVELLDTVFYRNKAAYVVGRIRRAHKIIPLVLPLLNGERGIFVDTVLLTEDEASGIFGFTRYYFLAKAPRPGEVIGFLHSIMPAKTRAELYLSLGFTKHGKTELFRDLYRHLGHSTDRFRFTRGAKGMVMIVFTLPSYDLVFKVIRDRFGTSKNVTRREVREKYRHVFRHDRVGRMVDIQEFENLTLDRERFTKELVDELEREAVESVTVGPTHVVLHHVYTERRVDPLDVFAKEASAERRERAAIDYGQAIKDLAAANVFPGDLLIKNFGVTRHGRVVFYDYDELCSLTECRFRTMPTARDDDEMSDGSWFYVGPNDVFPEELRSFIFSDPALAAAFDAVHGELYGVSFWHEQQRRHEAGELIDFFPYPSSVRFPR